MKKRKRGRPKNSKNSDKLANKLKYIDPDKVELILLIWRLQPKYKILEIDLTKYSLEQLQKHIELVKKKREVL